MQFFHLYSENDFDGIAREHMTMFYGLAMRILKNSADAEDAVQTALLRGWNRRIFLRTPEKLIGWLARIVVNESYNILRRKARNTSTPLSEVSEAQLASGNEAEELTQREEQMQKLGKAIATLPEIYRLTVHFAILSDMTSEEAATILDCSVNTLYQRIHKAKQLLREALKDE